MDTKFNFTKNRLVELSPPDSGRVYYYDTGCDNLALCVTETDAKTFYRYGRINGRPVRMKIGKFPTFSVENARTICKSLNGDIAKGEDPHAARMAKNKVKTLKELFDDWLPHAQQRKRSWANDQRMFNKYFTAWHNWKLPSITVAAVAGWHSEIGRKHGPIQANRCKALLRTLFNHAETIGYTSKNPCRNIKSFDEQSRERFLLPDEMQAFFKAVIAQEPKWRDFFLLCILTGQRKGNVQSMQWVEIDLINGIWTIPAAKSKAKKSITVPLSPPALAIVKRRYAENQAEKAPSPWVFPGRAGKCIFDPTKPWKSILAKSGIENLHIHDLRRSLGSWQAALGSSLAVIGKSLGHNDLESTQVYARLQLDPVRESVTKAGAAMLAAGGLVIDVIGEKRGT